MEPTCSCYSLLEKCIDTWDPRDPGEGKINVNCLTRKLWPLWPSTRSLKNHMYHLLCNGSAMVKEGKIYLTPSMHGEAVWHRVWKSFFTEWQTKNGLTRETLLTSQEKEIAVFSWPIWPLSTSNVAVMCHLLRAAAIGIEIRKIQYHESSMA